MEELIARHERRLVAAAALLGLAVCLIYVLATRHLALAGDELEYNSEATLIAHGKLFYTAAPYGIVHAGAWKAPGYPAWAGLWYWLGLHAFGLRLVQTPVAGLDVVLAWMLARRLAGPRVAMLAALLTALYPMAWQYTGLLYPEALATPLYLGLIILLLDDRGPVAFGVLLGLTLLVRPSTVVFVLPLLVVCVARRGWRSGVIRSLATVLVAAVIVAPWTIRNAVVLHGFLPISLEDAAAYGTFNATAAHHTGYLYAWLPDPPQDADLLDPHHPLPDIELHDKLIGRAASYIEHHPIAVPEAFFWNGLTRFWDLRGHGKSLVEVHFEGRSMTVARIGIWTYDVLALLALLGLWRLRRERLAIAALAALALGFSIAYTTDSGTRYRAPLEPVVAVLAAAGITAGGRGLRAG